MEHKITTIKELVDVANTENLQALLKDLENFLTLVIKFQEELKIDTSTFNWIDDGKSDITLTNKSENFSMKFVIGDI